MAGGKKKTGEGFPLPSPVNAQFIELFRNLSIGGAPQWARRLCSKSAFCSKSRGVVPKVTSAIGQVLAWYPLDLILGCIPRSRRHASQGPPKLRCSPCPWLHCGITLAPSTQCWRMAALLFCSGARARSNLEPRQRLYAGAAQYQASLGAFGHGGDNAIRPHETPVLLPVPGESHLNECYS